MLAIPAAGQLTLTLTANSTINTSYSAGDPDEDMDPSLSQRSNTSHPAVLDYNGATGTLTVNLVAPDGYRFQVTPADGTANFYFQVAYTTFLSGGAAGGLTATGSPTFTLLGLQGNAPTFNINSTIGDIPHAYAAVSASATVTQSFSFTALQMTQAFSGTGFDVDLPYMEGGNITISDGDYFGPAPSSNLTLLAVVAAVPEPGTYGLFAGLTAFLSAAWLRRRLA